MDESSQEDYHIVDEAPRSISCTRIPEAFLNKTTAVNHFSQFGRIRNFILRPRKYSCIVEYETANEAENAFLEAGSFNNEQFDISYTQKAAQKSKPADFVDPDVQDELEAMSNTVKKSAFGVSTFSGNRLGASSLFSTQNKNELRSSKLSRAVLTVDNTAPTISNSSQIKSSLMDSANDPPPVLSSVAKATKNELEAILRRPAFTPEEKFMVLDARDKLIRLTTTKNVDIKRAVSAKGICPDMCPEKERYSREAKRRVATFEAERDSKSVMNHQIGVKEYSRSSADQESPLPHELRPEPVLNITMKYLLQNIMDLCDDSETSICDWYHFLWDRTRSIRKDITQQDLCSPGTVLLVEQCARFHIHCAARCVAEEPQVFDQKINTENLTKCLQSLKYMYHDLGLKMIRCPNEAEFRAYVVLLNLHDSNFLWEVKQLREEILRSPEIQFAIKVYLAIESNNYVRFFSLVRSTTYMNSCILLRYFTQVRVKALNIMFKAYVPRYPVAMSISSLTYRLAFEDYEQCAQFLEYYGLTCDREEDRVMMDRSQFYYPDMPFLLDRAINVVEHKRHFSVGEAVHGCALDDKDVLEKYEPHDSFDDNGVLLPKAWTAEDQNFYKPEARIEARAEKANASFKEDDNIFKIPNALPPSSPRSSPKSRLSPKPMSTNDNVPSSANASTIFGGTTKAANTSENLFKTIQKPENKTQNNIFGGFPKAPQPQMNLFGNASTTTLLQQTKAIDAADGNSFKFVNSSSNTFFKPVTNVTQSSNSIFSSGFARNAETGENLFSQAKPSSNQTTASIFGGNNATADANLPTGIFGSFPINNTNQHQPQQSGFISTSSFQSVKSQANNANIFAGFNNNANSVAGITPLSHVDNNKSMFNNKSHEQKLLEDKLEREKQEKQKQLEEVERQRKAAIEEQEKQRKLEEERKDIERKRIEEKKLEIERAATKLTAELMDEYLANTIRELLNAEIERYVLEQKMCKICEELINDVIQTELEKIAFDIKTAWDKNILEKYFSTWRSVTRKAIEQRRKIEHTPVWLPTKTMRETVPELKHPLQAQTLSLMKRYLSGLPRKLIVPPIREDSIDLFSIITPELQKLRHHKHNGTLITSNIYWKCVISVPAVNEDPSHKTINQWLNNIFVRQLSKYPRSNEAFFVEQNDLNGQRLNVCMRKLSGHEMLNESHKTPEARDINGTNAIMFFFTTKNWEVTRRRLKSVLKAIELSDAASLIVYNLGRTPVDNVKEYLQLEELMDYEKIENCVFANDVHRRSGENLCHLTKLGLQYAAANSFYDDQLEMQNTTSFLRTCLTDELWQRIYVSVIRNPTLVEASTKFNFLMDYHNEAINRLISVCTPCVDSPHLFPFELNKFVPTHRLDLPLNLEYFPENWHANAEKHQQQFTEFLQALRIRHPINLHHVTDVSMLERTVLKFVQSHISCEREANRTTYKILSNIYAYLQPEHLDAIEFKERLMSYSWINSMPIFTTDLLTFQYQRFVNDQRLPDFVIYDKYEYQDFTRTQWWLQINEDLLKRLTVDVAKNIELEVDEFEQTRKRQRLETNADLEKYEFEKTLAEANERLENADKILAKMNEIHTICKDVSREFDYALYRQEREIRDMKDAFKSNTD